jgi:predicted SprT family Zn-dependent metalloprotease
MKSDHVTDSQFKAVKRSLEGPTPRGKHVHSVNLVRTTSHLIWNCPSCNYRNSHLNTGRGSYFCSNCDHDTDLKP